MVKRNKLMIACHLTNTAAKPFQLTKGFYFEEGKQGEETRPKVRATLI